MRKVFLFLILTILMQGLYAAPKTITGVVTSKEDKEPVIGASVAVKGTTNGTITDIDGKYSLAVNEGSTIVISYIGMTTQELRVSAANIYNAALSSSSIAVDEVVVTAMGIKAEKKKLNFAVQSVDANAISDGQSTNFVDALQGRIAGVDISGQGGSPTAASQIIIRGISSINPGQSNEPIFILDGVHISGGASKAAQINPSDIENITVLKGAAAAALYGQEAANGAIMITTKSGKAGALKVDASATIQIDEPFRVPRIQNQYINGAQGVWKEETSGGWGPMLKPGEQVYDNVGKYLGTGLYQKYDVSLSGGTEKINGLASANFTKHDGVVPNDYLNRWGIMLKGTYNISKVLSVSAMANIVGSTSRGANLDVVESSSASTGKMGSIYSWPINNDMSDYMNTDGSIRWRYIDPIQRKNSPVSPYWSRLQDRAQADQIRSLIQASLNWKIVKGLEFTGRVGYDRTDSETNAVKLPRFEKLYKPDGSLLYPEEQRSGREEGYYGIYKYGDSNSQMLSLTGLVTYELELGAGFKMNLLLGGDMKMENSRSSGLAGYDFNVPGIYSLKNVALLPQDEIVFNHRKKNTYGFYGEAKFDYKGIAHVGATIRNDHSSTLSADLRSYWYPSVSAGIIFSELFQISNDWFSYGKLRGNWAMVGKDAPPYNLSNIYKQWATFPDNGYGVDPAIGAANKLQPEFMSSWEIGVDLRFFNNKTKLDVAYYSTQVDNQIITVRVSPTVGNIQQTKNEGSVRNYGLEATIEQALIHKHGFSWDASLNLSFNRSLVVGLPDQQKELGSSDGYIGTDMKAVAYLGGSTMAVSGIDYERTADGKVVCTPDGLPKINATRKQVADREPKLTAGLQSAMKYKGWGLSFLVNFRLGGDVINATSRYLVSNGQSPLLANYRNRQIVIDGVVQQADGSYASNITPVTVNQDFINNYYAPVSTNFIEDGSFIRLSYITLSYDFAKLLKPNMAIKGCKLSFTGKNLFLITRYSGSDPQTNQTGSTGGSGTMGIDNLNVPGSQSFTFNANFTF